MITVNIPGYGDVEIKNLVLDYNGTLAKDGFLLDGLGEIINKIARSINVYVITANTFGNVETEIGNLPVKIIKLKNSDERNEKLELIKSLDPKVTASIGNGSNDELMLRESILGICIIGQEGCSTRALNSADLAINDIRAALELIIFPDRLKATLRF